MAFLFVKLCKCLNEQLIEAFLFPEGIVQICIGCICVGEHPIRSRSSRPVARKPGFFPPSIFPIAVARLPYHLNRNFYLGIVLFIKNASAIRLWKGCVGGMQVKYVVLQSSFIQMKHDLVRVVVALRQFVGMVFLSLGYGIVT
jgi:hypothetical protein